MTHLDSFTNKFDYASLNASYLKNNNSCLLFLSSSYYFYKLTDEKNKISQQSVVVEGEVETKIVFYFIKKKACRKLPQLKKVQVLAENELFLSFKKYKIFVSEKS